jgi:hypothetical protein
LAKKSINTSSEDLIRNEIDELFEGKIGSPPGSQEEINALYDDGEKRYENSIPPGFKDASKESEGQEDFVYDGILYKRKFGDLIIWDQLIKYAATKNLKNIIFVTDDNKSD